MQDKAKHIINLSSTDSNGIEDAKAFLHSTVVGYITKKHSYEMSNLLTGIVGYTSLVMNMNYSAKKKPFHLEQVVNCCETAQSLNELLCTHIINHTKKNPKTYIIDWLTEVVPFLDRVMGQRCSIQLHIDEDIQDFQVSDVGIKEIMLYLIMSAARLIFEEGQINVKLTKTTCKPASDNEPERTKIQLFVVAQYNPNDESGKPIIENKSTLALLAKNIEKESQSLSWKIARFISKSLNGAILFKDKNKAQVGFLFHFPFPSKKPSHDTLKQKKSKLTKPLSFVLLEDQPVVRDYIQDFLEKDGHVVTAFADGLELQKSLPILRPESIDLFLMDVYVPGASGIQTAQFIRNFAPRAKILLYSALTDEEKVEKILPMDKNTQFVRKPFKKQELIDKIITMLSSGEK